MHFAIMTLMFSHALESIGRNYSVISIFWWCFIIAKRKEKRTQFEQEGKVLHAKKMRTRKEREILLSSELLWGKARQASQTEWMISRASLILAKCQEKAVSKGYDIRIKRTLAWLQSIRRPDARTAFLPFLQVCVYISIYIQIDIYICMYIHICIYDMDNKMNNNYTCMNSILIIVKWILKPES